MLRITHSYKSTLACLWIGLTLIAVSMTACNKSEKATSEKSTQKTFSSPTEAGTALFEAAKSGDTNALLDIFGPDSKEVLLTGDAARDKDNLQDFAAAYTQMNRWVKVNSGGEVLYVGADNYGWPIPLGQTPDGRWAFDTAAGRDEILARRIGKNELSAIAALSTLAHAQQQYVNQTHDGERNKQYAQRFVSDDGKQNGLYWAVSEGQAPSPLGQLADFANTLGSGNVGGKPQPFNGYYFQILDKQGDKARGGPRDYVIDGKMTGGFAMLAYPAEYQNSGIMTFIVGQDGVVYQKDLGENTENLATSMSAYNPGDGWVSVDTEGTAQYVARKNQLFEQTPRRD
jgi:Protein of unknown function (DUF2950)